MILLLLPPFVLVQHHTTSFLKCFVASRSDCCGHQLRQCSGRFIRSVVDRRFGGYRSETQSSIHSLVTSRCGGADESQGDEGSSRLEQIKAAIQRGEARAARNLAGEAEPESAGETRQLTPEQEQALKSFFVQADADDEDDEPDDGAFDVELVTTAAEYRINKTLEFCPDGVLAFEILQDMCSNGTVPGAQAWTAVIDAFGQRDALDEALDVYSSMQRARVAAADGTYDALARPAMRRGEFKFVETLYGAKASDRGGGIGSESLSILLDAYANGRPPQPRKAEAAFRNELEVCEEKGLLATSVASSDVLRALRRSLGLNQTCELCWELGIDPALAL